MKDSKRVICGGKDCKLRMFNSLGNVEWEINVGKSDLVACGRSKWAGHCDWHWGDQSQCLLKVTKLWEYDTSRAMVGVGVSRNGANVVACADEFLYCLDSEGNLSWKKQRSDALWDVDIEKTTIQ